LCLTLGAAADVERFHAAEPGQQPGACAQTGSRGGTTVGSSARRSRSGSS